MRVTFELPDALQGDLIAELRSRNCSPRQFIVEAVEVLLSERRGGRRLSPEDCYARKDSSPTISEAEHE